MESYLSLHSSLDTPDEGTSRFRLCQLSGEESLCEDFCYTIHANTSDRLSKTEMESLVGDSMTVDIAYRDRKSKPNTRYINGVVYTIRELGFSRAPLDPEIWRYEITLGSWLKQLDFVKDYRIFQKKGNTRLQIITDLLWEKGFTAFKNKVAVRLPEKEYAVLYGETLSNFIRRNLWEDGILWYFEHHRDKHMLVFTDDPRTLPDIKDSAWGQKDEIQSFGREGRFLPLTSCFMASYDWETPPVKLVSWSTGNKKARLVDYLYKGRFKKRDHGESIISRSAKAHKINQRHYTGKSTVRVFSAGSVFNLFAPTLPDLHNQGYLIKKLTINATEEQYTNEFEACSAKEGYVPVTADSLEKPLVEGSQTARVVGEKGSGEVQTDKLGRVKVRFHWDFHSPDQDTNTSAFIRVAGACAGTQRGHLFTPRVDEEVVISFEDGDPDNPLIIGSVYSHGIKPSVNPGANPLVGVIKTDGDPKSNRIEFNEKPDKETFEIKAKKDLYFIVGRHLNIDVKDDVIVNADKIKIIVRKNVTINAGSDIVHLTLDEITNTAGTDINNMAVGSIVNVTGGLSNNLAGKTITNTAVMQVEHHSDNAMATIADTMLSGFAGKSIANIGPRVINDAGLGMSNISQGGMMNKAAKDVKTEAMFHKATVDETSTTETSSFKIKGLMSKIN